MAMPCVRDLLFKAGALKMGESRPLCLTEQSFTNENKN